MLQITGKGLYKLTDNYIYHIRITSSDKEIFLVTSQRIMYIIRSYWSGSYKVFLHSLNNMKNTVYLKLLFKLDSMGVYMVGYDQTSKNKTKWNLTSWKK